MRISVAVLGAVLACSCERAPTPPSSPPPAPKVDALPSSPDTKGIEGHGGVAMAPLDSPEELARLPIADVLLRGDALRGSDPAAALAHFRFVMSVAAPESPEHRRAALAVRELETALAQRWLTPGDARESYLRGYQLKESHPDEAVRVFTDIVRRTPPDSETHQKALARIRELQR